MTCHELRLYFEDPLRPDAEFSAEAEHLAHCAECARFVETRRQLGAGLRLLRTSAPQPSPALEAAVLANYRRHLADHPSSANSITRRRGFAVLGWSAAAVVVALAAALVLHSARTPDHSTAMMVSIQKPSVSQPIHVTTSVRSTNTVAAAEIGRLHSARHPRPVPSADALTPAPQDFRSLMYCDPLSCAGAMQLIRVQLPPSSLAFEPTTNVPIYADVLVGPDGVARGIRVVQ